MSIIKIPEQLINGEVKKDAYIIDYEHNIISSRQKVSFDYFTISFLIEGAKEIYSSNESEEILASNFLIVKKGNCLMTETLSKSSNYKSKLITFSNNFLLQFISKYNVNIDYEDNEQTKLYRVLPFDNYIKLYIKSLNILPSDRMQETKIEELLIYCYETYGNQFFSFLKEDRYSSSLRKVIEKQITKGLSVDELAFLCSMSLSTFKRAFYQEYRSTPSKWIKKRRLELSKNDLKDKGLRASDIYLKYGFGSLSRYISAFKKEYGVTPKQFQQHSK